MAQYDTIILGYPNWGLQFPCLSRHFWKNTTLRVKPLSRFAINGGGRFGQSLTAIAKLEPRAKIGEALSINYSGGNSLSNDITAWLRKNGIAAR
jgi:hypothetical protein